MKTLTIILLFLSSIAHAEDKVELTTQSNYNIQAFIHDDGSNDIGIVFLHGKKGDPATRHHAKFIDKMVDKHYALIAPVMPWSEKRGYEGTRQQGYEVIDEAIKKLDKDKVAIIGFSIGATAVLQYAAIRDNPKLAGIIAIAPAHDPNIAGKFRRITQQSANTACREVASGNNKDKANYAEMNKGQQYSIYAANEYYCSYYNTEKYPNTFEVVRRVDKPTFILSGKKDKLTKVYKHRKLYNNLPDNDLNSYKSLPGKHLSVLFKHTDKVANWIEGL